MTEATFNKIVIGEYNTFEESVAAIDGKNYIPMSKENTLFTDKYILKGYIVTKYERVI